MEEITGGRKMTTRQIIRELQEKTILRQKQVERNEMKAIRAGMASDDPSSSSYMETNST